MGICISKKIFQPNFWLFFLLSRDGNGACCCLNSLLMQTDSRNAEGAWLGGEGKLLSCSAGSWAPRSWLLQGLAARPRVPRLCAPGLTPSCSSIDGRSPFPSPRQLCCVPRLCWPPATGERTRPLFGSSRS